MSVESGFQGVNMNLSNSPARKRARYDTSIVSMSEEPVAASAENWSLARGDVVYNRFEECGVGRLDYDYDYPPSDDDTIFEKDKPGLANGACISMTPDTREKQAAIIESVLSKETVNKLSLGEWSNFLIKKNVLLEENSSRENHFEKLPDEIVLQIFRCMPKRDLVSMSQTCKRFYTLSEDESLWTRMDMSLQSLVPGSVGQVLKRQIVILRMARTEVMYPPILPPSPAMSPDFRCRLLYLDLSMADISPESLIMIFERCHRLKKLSIENVQINSSVLKALANSTDIETVNFAMVEGFDLEGLTYFFNSCRIIKELNIAWTYLRPECISFIAKNLPSTIHRLNISGCRKYMNDNDVANIVNSCPGMRELDLSDNTTITGQAIRYLLQLEDLNFLALSRCYYIPYKQMLHLAKMRNLQYLDIHGGYIQTHELNEIQEALPHVGLNKFRFSSIARPTVGLRRSSIWGMRSHD